MMSRKRLNRCHRFHHRRMMDRAREIVASGPKFVHTLERLFWTLTITPVAVMRFRFSTFALLVEAMNQTEAAQ